MRSRIPFNGGECLSPHTCADAIEPVLLGLSARSETPALEDIATQLALPSTLAMNVDPADNESAAAETGACGSSIEQIRHELHLASLRQVELQKRIRAIRDALIALINVFGPEILNEQRNDSPASGKYVSRAEVASVCVQILRTFETEWLTAHQILELIRKHRPLTLADSKNPGTSLSNILRGLGPAVQSRAGENNKIVWRWAGEKYEDPQSSQTAATMQGFPLEETRGDIPSSRNL